MSLWWTSFSTWLHLLTPPLGKEHPCQQPRGTHGTKLQDQRGTRVGAASPCHSATSTGDGFQRPVPDRREVPPSSRKTSPRRVRLHRGLFRWRQFGSQQVCSDFWLSKTHAWCPGCSECTCFYGFAAKHILPKRKLPSMVCRAELR